MNKEYTINNDLIDEADHFEDNDEGEEMPTFITYFDEVYGLLQAARPDEVVIDDDEVNMVIDNCYTCQQPPEDCVKEIESTVYAE